MPDLTIALTMLAVIALVVFYIRWKKHQDGGPGVADISTRCGLAEDYLVPRDGPYVLKVEEACSHVTVSVDDEILQVWDAATGAENDLRVPEGGVVALRLSKGQSLNIKCEPGNRHRRCKAALYRPDIMPAAQNLFQNVQARQCNEWQRITLWAYDTVRLRVTFQNPVCSDPGGPQQAPLIKGPRVGATGGRFRERPVRNRQWEGDFSPGGGGGLGNAVRLMFKCPGSQGGPCVASVTLLKPR